MTTFLEIPTNMLFVSDKNVRKTANSEDEYESNLETLTKDIKYNGLINPISVRKVNEKYEIYAGQRRYNAIKNLKWDKVPCMVSNYDDKKIELLSLAENIQRNRMNMVDKCTVFHKYYQLNNKSIDKVAEITSLAPSTVRNYVFVKENLNSKLLPNLDAKGGDKLTMETAKDICKNVPDKAKQKEAFEKTKNLADNDEKKKVLEKIKANPDKKIEEIIDEITDSEDEDEFDLRNNPWTFDFKNKGHKVKIPHELHDLVYNMVISNKK